MMISSVGEPSAINLDVETRLLRGRRSTFKFGLPRAWIVKGTASFARFAFPERSTVTVVMSSI